MTKAEKDLILYLIYSSGADCCSKCIHLNSAGCCKFISPTDYSGKGDDNYCIAGMKKYFKHLRGKQ